MNDNEEIVKEGTYLYDGVVVCDVRILKKCFKPESGDLADPEDTRIDKLGTFFRIEFGSAVQREANSSASFWLGSLNEAIAEVEGACPNLKWLK